MKRQVTHSLFEWHTRFRRDKFDMVGERGDSSGVSENIKCKVWWSGKRYIYQAVTVGKSAFFVDTLYFKWKIRKWAKSSEFQVRRKMLRKH